MTLNLGGYASQNTLSAPSIELASALRTRRNLSLLGGASMVIVSLAIGVLLNLPTPLREVMFAGGSVAESAESQSVPLSVPASQAKRSTSSSSIHTPPGRRSMLRAPTNQSGDSLKLATKVRWSWPREARWDSNFWASVAPWGKVPSVLFGYTLASFVCAANSSTKSSVEPVSANASSPALATSPALK